MYGDTLFVANLHSRQLLAAISLHEGEKTMLRFDKEHAYGIAHIISWNQEEEEEEEESNSVGVCYAVSLSQHISWNKEEEEEEKISCATPSIFSWKVERRSDPMYQQVAPLVSHGLVLCHWYLSDLDVSVIEALDAETGTSQWVIHSMKGGTSSKVKIVQ